MSREIVRIDQLVPEGTDGQVPKIAGGVVTWADDDTGTASTAYFTITFTTAAVLSTSLTLDAPCVIAIPSTKSIRWLTARVAVDTAPTGADLIIDIQRSTNTGTSWASIFVSGSSNQLICTATNKAGSKTTFVSPEVLSVDGEWLKPVVTQVGSTVAGGEGAVITLTGEIV